MTFCFYNYLRNCHKMQKAFQRQCNNFLKFLYLFNYLFTFVFFALCVCFPHSVGDQSGPSQRVCQTASRRVGKGGLCLQGTATRLQPHTWQCQSAHTTDASGSGHYSTGNSDDHLMQIRGFPHWLSFH